MNSLIKASLLPFAILYKTATSFRNYLYNIGYKKAIHFATVTISVGNLTVGGTGKTPHVEYLIKLLKKTYRVATLSRGYGRKSKGFILADAHSAASTIGDEPMQFYLKFKNEIKVAVGEERILAIPAILHEAEDVQVIILDDAFQHRKVERDINILLSDYNNPFYSDFLLPAGRLRESRKGAQRADVVIVTKCPASTSAKERESIIRQIRKYSRPSIPIFFTTIVYGTPIPVFENGYSFEGKVLLVSGIAKANLLESYVREKFNFFKHLKFKDHHHYTKIDVEDIIKELDSIKDDKKALLTTEKDMVKWKEVGITDVLNKYPVYYLPIEIGFIENRELFENWILESISRRIKQIEESD